jgi:uncharacterized protein YkwD
MAVLTLVACVPSTIGVAPSQAEPASIEPLQPEGEAQGLALSDEIVALERELASYLALRSNPQAQAFARAVLNDLNQMRAAAGLEPLVMDLTLVRIGELRAADMVANEYFAHTHPRRGTLEAERLLRSMGYRGQVAELILSSTGSLEEIQASIVATWLADRNQREQITAARYSSAGLGLTVDGTWWYIVLLLAESHVWEK